MKRIKKTRVLASVFVVLSVVLLTISAVVTKIPATEVNSHKALDDVDMCDFTNWMSGEYLYGSGVYCKNSSRLALKEYVTCDADEDYMVTISDTKYHVLIRELDSEDKFIKSWNLENGQEFVTSNDTRSLAISLYCPSNEKIDYNTYKNIFKDGFGISINKNSDKLVENIDMTNINNWRSGCFSWWDGSYMIHSQRICINQYLGFNSESFKVEITDSDYKLSIREKDANGNFIKSVLLSNEDEYIPSENAKMLGISLYNGKSEKNITFDTYKNIFSDGFKAQLITEKAGESNNTDENENSNDTSSTGNAIENCDMTDFNNWVSGCYSWTDGNFMEYEKRISLKEYKTFSIKAFNVFISDTDFQLAVREKDADGIFKRTVLLKNGDVYKPSDDAVYLGITLYRNGSEWGITYDTYKKMFESGFMVNLTVMISNTLPSDTDEPLLPDNSQGTDIIEDTDGNGISNDNSASTGDTDKKEYTNFKDELRDMLESGDMTIHDISKYNLTYQQMNAIYNELANGECYLAAKSYCNAFLKTEMENGKVKTVYMYNADKGFPERYALMKAEVANVISKVSPQMSDMEKTLFLHDYIVEKTTYKDGYGAHCAANPLAYGWGVCEGYAKALEVLLHEVGIKSYMLVSNQLNHAWNVVVIDGQRYHIDATWDDTRTRKSGQIDHEYFIRNDNEFRNELSSKHYDWYSDKLNTELGITGRNNTYSTSTQYTGWFVHDITGKLIYDNGYWYYAENNTLVKSKIDGSCKSVVIKGSGSIELFSIESKVITYKESGNVKTYTIK